jgi:hypothetical protein
VLAQQSIIAFVSNKLHSWAFRKLNHHTLDTRQVLPSHNKFFQTKPLQRVKPAVHPVAQTQDFLNVLLSYLSSVVQNSVCRARSLGLKAMKPEKK